jgi:hypothetical protein
MEVALFTWNSEHDEMNVSCSASKIQADSSLYSHNLDKRFGVCWRNVPRVHIFIQCHCHRLDGKCICRVKQLWWRFHCWIVSFIRISKELRAKARVHSVIGAIGLCLPVHRPNRAKHSLSIRKSDSRGSTTSSTLWTMAPLLSREIIGMTVCAYLSLSMTISH